MKPIKCEFWIYANCENEVKQLEGALRQIVTEQYNAGRLVTASELLKAADKLRKSPFILNLL